MPGLLLQQIVVYRLCKELWPCGNRHPIFHCPKLSWQSKLPSIFTQFHTCCPCLCSHWWGGSSGWSPMENKGRKNKENVTSYKYMWLLRKHIMKMPAAQATHLFYGLLVVNCVNNANHICLRERETPTQTSIRLLPELSTSLTVNRKAWHPDWPWRSPGTTAHLSALPL